MTEREHYAGELFEAAIAVPVATIALIVPFTERTVIARISRDFQRIALAADEERVFRTQLVDHNAGEEAEHARQRIFSSSNLRSSESQGRVHGGPEGWDGAEDVPVQA